MEGTPLATTACKTQRMSSLPSLRASSACSRAAGRRGGASLRESELRAAVGARDETRGQERVWQCAVLFEIEPALSSGTRLLLLNSLLYWVSCGTQMEWRHRRHGRYDRDARTGQPSRRASSACSSVHVLRSSHSRGPVHELQGSVGILEMSSFGEQLFDPSFLALGLHPKAPPPPP